MSAHPATPRTRHSSETCLVDYPHLELSDPRKRGPAPVNCRYVVAASAVWCDRSIEVDVMDSKAYQSGDRPVSEIDSHLINLIRWAVLRPLVKSLPTTYMYLTVQVTVRVSIKKRANLQSTDSCHGSWFQFYQEGVDK